MTGVALALLAACDTGGTSGDTGSAAADPATTPSAPAASAAAVPVAAVAEGRPVASERLAYAEVGEQLVYGHFAFPEDWVRPLPGLIVIHERWGLDDRTRALADRIAAQGYVVLAIDLYAGQTASSAQDARTLMVELVEHPEPANDNIRQAHQFLVNSPQVSNIGVFGWSLGGTWAINAALLLPDSLDAVVSYYGQVTENQERLAALDAPLLGIFGSNDRGVRPENVAAFEAALTALGKEHEIEIFPGAGHAFADPAASTYNAAAARAAWARTVEFLDRHLSAGSR